MDFKKQHAYFSTRGTCGKTVNVVAFKMPLYIAHAKILQTSNMDRRELTRC